MGKGRLWVAVGVMLLWACARPATSGAPTDRAHARNLRHFVADWHRIPDGQAPSDWVDLHEDGADHAWLYDGGWRIQRVDGTPHLLVPKANTTVTEPLSFRRYNGGAFGVYGQLPARYCVVLEGRSLGGAARFNGYGELACQVFYLTPTSYVEVLQTDEAFFIWQADNAPPMQGSGWTQVARVPHPAKVGEWVRFGAEVDTQAGTIVALLDDQPVATASPSLMAQGREPKLTLRATGNKEEWRVVEIRELP
ncbi:MAG TPA: hypothetical protein V6D05_06170 [Stenomitos sp.]